MISTTNPSACCLYYNNNQEETRGSKKIITLLQIRKIEEILEKNSIEERSLTWVQLGTEAEVEASVQTIQQTIDTIDYYKHIVCQKGWVSLLYTKNRVGFAKAILKKYLQSEDWYCVRFTDKIYFGWGPQYKL